MKALIFNSGLGKRMGILTQNNPKCMIPLYNGESIFERQIRLLSQCGIEEFVVTTGPFKEQLIEVASKYKYLKFTFVENNDYEKNNCIVSMYNAYDYLNDDMLVLHGDLVFDKNLVKEILNNEYESLCLINEEKELPQKDFKGKIENGLLRKISVDIFDEDCYTFQPFYKLSKNVLEIWKNEVKKFVERGIVDVYAENALNEILHRIEIHAISYKNFYIDEIDDKNDYKRVSNDIKNYDYVEQDIVFDSIQNIKKYIKKSDNIFVVCTKYNKDILSNIFDGTGCKYELFTKYQSNPKYEDIMLGLKRFKETQSDKIIAIGGGSVIDVAKCIKAFYSMENSKDFLYNQYKYNNIELIAIPTTAGTGSESTRFAVMYYNEKKYSISHEFLLPNLVILDKNFLRTLPDYQKKSTLLDALCQAIESYWSKASNDTSKEYSEKCIKLILDNYKDYLKNKEESFSKMLLAANYSGKAINITTTTLPHAMSYKVTSLYNISHGHAVGLLFPYIWKYMNNDLKSEKLHLIFNEIAIIMGYQTVEDAINFMFDIYKMFNLSNPLRKEDLNLLVNSVNIERLCNNPITYNKEQLKDIYMSVISKK